MKINKNVLYVLELSLAPILFMCLFSQNIIGGFIDAVTDTILAVRGTKSKYDDKNSRF